MVAVLEGEGVVQAVHPNRAALAGRQRGLHQRRARVGGEKPRHRPAAARRMVAPDVKLRATRPASASHATAVDSVPLHAACGASIIVVSATEVPDGRRAGQPRTGHRVDQARLAEGWCSPLVSPIVGGAAGGSAFYGKEPTEAEAFIKAGLQAAGLPPIHNGLLDNTDATAQAIGDRLLKSSEARIAEQRPHETPTEPDTDPEGFNRERLGQARHRHEAAAPTKADARPKVRRTGDRDR